MTYTFSISISTSRRGKRLPTRFHSNINENKNGQFEWSAIARDINGALLWRKTFNSACGLAVAVFLRLLLWIWIQMNAMISKKSLAFVCVSVWVGWSAAAAVCGWNGWSWEYWARLYYQNLISELIGERKGGGAICGIREGELCAHSWTCSNVLSTTTK